MWNVPRLFRYSLDHLKRWFADRKIHPAVVLAVARKHGIPDLIKPAVLALAEPEASLHSWCCDSDVLRFTAVEEIGAIARMRERLYNAQLALQEVPPVIHGYGCTDTVSCVRAWKSHWHEVVGMKLRKLNDRSVFHQLWWIRSKDILGAQIPGMPQLCLNQTVEKVAGNPGWFSDATIVDGIILYLMVTEHVPNWAGQMAIDS